MVSSSVRGSLSDVTSLVFYDSSKLCSKVSDVGTAVIAIDHLSQEKVEGVITSRYRNVTSVKGFLFMPSWVIHEVAEYCPNLTHLNLGLTSSSVTEEDVIAVARRCKRLQKVIISSSQVTDHSIMTLVEECIGLKSLFLSGTQVTDKTINFLVSSNVQIEELNLFRNREVSNDSLVRLVKMKLLLKTLIITDTNLSEKVLKAIPEGNAIQTLYLTLSDRITSEDLCQFLRRSSNVKELTVDLTCALSKKQIQELEEAFQFLSSLSLWYSKEVIGCIKELQDALKRLKSQGIKIEYSARD